MNQLFQILFRAALLLLGLFFFLGLLFVAAIGMVVIGIRYAWYKLTGRTPQKMGWFRVNPMDGFGYFYTRTKTPHSDAPRSSQRPMDDVTDVEIKEIIHVEEMGSDPNKKEPPHQ